MTLFSGFGNAYARGMMRKDPGCSNSRLGRLGWHLFRQTMGVADALIFRVPVNGFKDLQGADGPRRFTIEKSGDPSMLPKSHTCFNRVSRSPDLFYVRSS